jgi:uncharacterized protein
MKYLLVLAVVMVAFWIWRNNRLGERSTPPPPPPPGSKALRPPTPMVACLDCGTHLPEAEAVQGRQGPYCSADHRQRHEGLA